jgi:hypothetical protein
MRARSNLAQPEGRRYDCRWHAVHDEVPNEETRCDQHSSSLDAVDGQREAIERFGESFHHSRKFEDQEVGCRW